jgi:hypothetical protein
MVPGHAIKVRPAGPRRKRLKVNRSADAVHYSIGREIGDNHAAANQIAHDGKWNFSSERPTCKIEGLQGKR